ncbi:MAG: hypothetical protein LBP78_00045 [Acidaminococcales bacterium]|jgi:hypothetical protein|nr:hypothetical protein [Acidaminococcales bacterium]
MTVNVLQCTFSGGEVAEDVAARVDLDKYQESLLRAKNVFIRPYGGAYKRPGTRHVWSFAGAGGPVRLSRFAKGSETAFLLVFTPGALDIYLDDVLEASIETPFRERDLPNLDFAQSADTLFVASGSFPVKRLFREADESFSLSDFPVHVPPFGELASDISLSVSAPTDTVTVTAGEDVFSAGWVGDFIKFYQSVPAGTVDVGDSTALLVGEGWSFITRGNWTGTVTIERRDTEDGLTVGGWYKFKEYKSAYSTDTAKNGGANYTDSGATPDQPFFLRLVTGESFVNHSAGTNGTLTVNSYIARGVVKLTSVESAAQATGVMVKPLGQAGEVKSWARGLWNGDCGWPKNLCFFQDRLCFGGSDYRPNGLWLSRTSDYTNFDVTEAAGKLTDDSAINTAVIAREFFDIRALVSARDLLVFTSGDIWLISGESIVKPSEFSIRAQAACGASNIPPLLVGSRVIYVQQGQSRIRDAGYSFEGDGYQAEELTVLIPHLAGGAHRIMDIQALREPEQLVFALRGDGALLCLTYLREQKVFAWSTVETQGRFAAICAIASGGRDFLYAVVDRPRADKSTARHLEKLTDAGTGDWPPDYCMADCAEIIKGNTSKTIAGLGRFAGQRVMVAGDDYLFDAAGYLVGEDGTLTLPDVYADLVIGLGYELELVLPDLHANLSGSGSTLGARRALGRVMLRVESSFGGVVYTDEALPARDIFTLKESGMSLLEPNLRVRLVTGVTPVTLPQDTNYHGRVAIRHGAALPFKLSALSREVKFT